MALQEIGYGSVARSQILNDNFDYLDDRITDVGSSITSVQSSIQSVNAALISVSNNSVTISTDQGISGFKSFNYDADTENDSNNCIQILQPSAITQNRPTYNHINFRDNLNNNVVGIGSVMYPDGTGGGRISAWNSTSNQWVTLFETSINAPARYIYETYVNGASWYRIWSDGWIEQGGYSWNPTFLKSFSDTNYTIIPVGTTFQYAVRVVEQTTSGCTFEQWHTAAGTTSTNPVHWYACGY